MRKRNKGWLKRQLTSQEGASLALALLFFVLCAVVGVVILTAATASAGRMSQADEQLHYNQMKYALDGAEDIICSNLCGKTFTAVGYTGESAAPNGTMGSSTTSASASGGLDSISTLLASLAQSLLSSQWISISVENDLNNLSSTNISAQGDTNIVTIDRSSGTTGTASTIASGKVEISLESNTSSDPFPTVTCELSIDSYGDITVSMATSTSDDESLASSMMIQAQPITIAYDKVLGSTSTTQQTRITYTLQWEDSGV